MKVRFISDLHFGHENMATHRGFSSAIEHDEYIIQCWNDTVTNKKDITYILGDITMEHSKFYYLLDRLNGIKHVVLGNHDRRQDVPKLLEYVESVSGMINCIKDDNRIDNLEMVTQSQNTKHAWDNNRMKLTDKDEFGVFTSTKRNHTSQQKLF